MKFLAVYVTFFISIQNLHCQHHNGRNIKHRLNFFDIELLRASVDGRDGNVLVSPASVKSTLAMLLAGADGRTARELEDALRVSTSREDLRGQFNQYLNALQSNTSKAVLQNANGIFVSKKLKLNPKYESVVKHDYLSEVSKLDYNDPAAAGSFINNWVSGHTRGLIPFVVEPSQISTSTDIVVANALYFKSNWHHAFDPRETRSSCFYRRGDCNMVAMMDIQAELNYAHVEDLRAHAVEIPYEGKRYSMIILVPLVKDGIEALIRDLPYISLPQITELMRSQEVLLSLPKFTIDYNQDLVEPLRKMQIISLFSNQSNLSKIFEGDVAHVNSFHHKVFISVDETGTVAAAASAAMVVPLIYTGRVEVRADRPFLFFIRDNELGIVLFEGKIEEPSILEQGLHNIPPPSTMINRQSYPTVESTNKPKSKNFVENLRSIFG